MDVFLENSQTALTPPPPTLPFWKLHCAFLPKIYRFETNKICNVIFWIGNDPPPFGSFPKKHPFSGIQSPLRPSLVSTHVTVTSVTWLRLRLRRHIVREFHISQ